MCGCFALPKVKTETALENHVKSHSGIRDLKCHICEAAFASRYTLNGIFFSLFMFVHPL